jgi:signal transduction histidine kinase
MRIAHKIILLFVALVMFLLIAVSFFWFNDARKILFSEFDEKIMILIDSLTIAGEYPLLVGNMESLDKIARGTVAQKDVVYCEIRDEKGNALAAFGAKKRKNVKEFTVPISVTEKAPPEEELIFGFSEEIKERKKEIGSIYLIFSLDRLTAKLEMERRVLVFFITTGILLAFLFINILVRVVLARPLSIFSEGIKKISDGKLSYKVPIKTNDEIGRLAISFNNMVDRLRDITVSREEMEKYSRDLEKINKELDDFTYIVSHDLQEPLRSIDAYAKFVMEDYKDKLDDTAKHYLERVKINAITMQNLINDLLELSRIERRKAPLDSVKSEELIKHALFRLEYMIKKEKARIVIKDKLPVISCYAVRLGEVFLNLISNAVKFSDKKRTLVEIGCKEKKFFYEFYVKDNGPGIDEKYFDKIFGLFQRLERKEKYKGTGAGLAIAKKIVEMHDGKIWVESKQGEGTVFYFTVSKNIKRGGEDGEDR